LLLTIKVGAPKTSFSWALLVASFNFSLIAGSLIFFKKISLSILHCSSSGIKISSLEISRSSLQ